MEILINNWSLCPKSKKVNLIDETLNMNLAGIHNVGAEEAPAERTPLALQPS